MVAGGQTVHGARLRLEARQFDRHQPHRVPGLSSLELANNSISNPIQRVLKCALSRLFVRVWPILWPSAVPVVNIVLLVMTTTNLQATERGILESNWIVMSAQVLHFLAG